LACDFPIQNNYFAWQAFARQYDTEQKEALPRYLKAWHHAALKEQVDKVSIHHCSMTDQLKTLSASSLTSYVLLDAQDWMDAQQLNALWTEINRTARPGARVVFRTSGIISPLEEKLSPSNLSAWKADSTENDHWTRQDRSAIYGRVHVYVRED
jgi:S-adenosylmethionine-diacylglycerol 3-amino-3-carboxypropyl transferase